ncbi:karyopherin beta [Boothiomyces sp. JEL0838]|nr:karyopherin beta [Boothiomyces sp. JEL0838]
MEPTSGPEALLVSFLVILVSEIGDKTFLIAAVMAMTHPRLLIFSAAMGALIVMTILSALMGQILPQLISKQYTELLASVLFLVFGFKLIKDAYGMSGNECMEELDEVTQELDNTNKAEEAALMEEGQQKRYVLAYRKGDRSQIATVALSGAQDFWWVTIGGLAGHAICSACAVVGGRMVRLINPVAATREGAQQQLENYSKENFPQFMGMLCQELGNEGIHQSIRQSAGLMMKNAIEAKNFERQRELSERWMGVDQNTRNQIKTMILHSLGSTDATVGTVAGQIVAAIANIELNLGQWGELIGLLLERVQNATTSLSKKSALQCLGFICEVVQSDILTSQSNAILTAVADGAAKKETNPPEVRFTALQALANSLTFIRENFNREEERNYVMQIVCEATQTPDSADVQVMGFECLVKIIAMYYDFMTVYMQKALYGLTLVGMRHNNERVVLQAIEFWSTICEIECDRNYAIQDGDTSMPCYHFAMGAAPETIPVLLHIMTTQEEDEDGDEWTPSMAAATCLQLFASVCGSNIIQYVLPFIKQHIVHENWRYRDTACMAFGSIIDGPEPQEMSQLVTEALPILLQLVSDQSPVVKDSAAWTLGRICENLLEVIQPQEIQAIVDAVIRGLNDTPKIAGSCAWSITCLAEQLGTKNHQDASSSLSPYFEPLVGALMTASQKPGVDTNFQQSAFEAISVLIENSAKDCSPLIANLCQMTVDRLAYTVTQVGNLVGDDERRAYYQNQANLCSILTSIIHYDPVPIRAGADIIMQNLLVVISNAHKDSTVKEEAFVAIGAVASAVEGDFLRYMDSLMPFILAALTNYEDYTVCSIVLGVLGDVCRALGDSILSYCEPLINSIGQLLSYPNLHRKVRPSCLSAIGDLSLAIGGKFEVYVHPAMGIIGDISNQLMYIPQFTQEQYDYVVETREAIAEAYVGICQGLKQAEKGALLVNYANQIFGFLEVATQEAEKSESYVKIMMGLLGDLADTIPPGHLKAFFGASWVAQFIKDVKTDRHCNPETKNYARWTRELIRRQL